MSKPLTQTDVDVLQDFVNAGDASAAAQTEDSQGCADMRFWAYGPDRLSDFVCR